MVVQKDNDDTNINGEQPYELVPPDGGWGYVVAVATVVLFCVTVIPTAAFGLIYGDFLKGIGDETTGTTLSNGIFNTVNSFTGLLANGLLNKYSYRMVGLVGSVIFVIGAVALIFTQNLFQLILFFGIIEGFGFGLAMPAVMSAFNAYFDKKMNFVMAASQALMIAFNIGIPPLAAWSVATVGFRGTLAGLAILGTLLFPAMAILQPVKKHMKKVYIQPSNSTIKIQVAPLEYSTHTKKSLPSDVLIAQIEPLMHKEKHSSQRSLHTTSLAHYEKHIGTSQRSLHSNVHHHKSRLSVVSLGDRVASITTINETVEEEKDVVTDKEHQEDESFWKSFAKSMDMSLLNDPKYLNISIGLALCFTGDMAFISIIPMILRNIGYTSQEIATMMLVFFSCDLVSRILLTFVSYAVTFRNRLLVLFAALFISAARTALVLNDDYMWKMIVLGILGFLRCFIQTPLPLVISEEYSDRFSTAFSLFMALNGIVSLAVGFFLSYVKIYTQSDIMVCHVLTVVFILCVISWTVELTFRSKKNKEVMVKS